MGEKPNIEFTKSGAMVIRRKNRKIRIVPPKRVEFEKSVFHYSNILHNKHGIDDKTIGLMIGAFKTGWNTHANIRKKVNRGDSDG